MTQQREPRAQTRERFGALIDRLDSAMPEAEIELDYASPLELLVAVILAAQCTDRRVNLVSPPLFADFPTAAHYAAATPGQLRTYISTLGLFRNKAKSLAKLGVALVEGHGGVVPVGRAALAKLPGVGPKTAGVVSMHLGGDEAFPVDTHVTRLSRRLGLTHAKNPDRIEADLQRLLPSARWFKAHQLLVWHGRRVCHARKPECHRCVVAQLCPKRGVKVEKKKPLAPRLLSG